MKFFERFKKEENSIQEEEPMPQEPKAFQESAAKSRALGWFALTAQDHKNIGSTPNDALKENFGKVQYEIMSDQAIEETLDGALQTIMEGKRSLVENGYAQIQKDFFVKSLSFLKGVNRLPAKFENFDIASLPDFEALKKRYRESEE